jgi:hypothetical protein
MLRLSALTSRALRSFSASPMGGSGGLSGLGASTSAHSPLGLKESAAENVYARAEDERLLKDVLSNINKPPPLEPGAGAQ